MAPGGEGVCRFLARYEKRGGGGGGGGGGAVPSGKEGRGGALYERV